MQAISSFIMLDNTSVLCFWGHQHLPYAIRSTSEKNGSPAGSVVPGDPLHGLARTCQDARESRAGRWRWWWIPIAIPLMRFPKNGGNVLLCDFPSSLGNDSYGGRLVFRYPRINKAVELSGTGTFSTKNNIRGWPKKNYGNLRNELFKQA